LRNEPRFQAIERALGQTWFLGALTDLLQPMCELHRSGVPA
jgi:hypothetical protein